MSPRGFAHRLDLRIELARLLRVISTVPVAFSKAVTIGRHHSWACNDDQLPWAAAVNGAAIAMQGDGASQWNMRMIPPHSACYGNADGGG
jgi:hypothetical protein